MSTKLNDEQLDAILTLSTNPDLSKAEIGRRVGLSRETVRDVLKRLPKKEPKSWQECQAESVDPGVPIATDLPDQTAQSDT
jgi:DNA-binding MarR family transcriptional regulator